MATSDNTQTLPTRKIVLEAPTYKFSYTVIVLTERCYLVEADHTGVVRQFAGATAMRNFFSALKVHLDEKYAAPLAVAA